MKDKEIKGYECLCIDGQWCAETKVKAYCKAHKGYLTSRQRKLHRCIERECMHYKSLRSKKE